MATSSSLDTMTEDQLREHLYRDLQGRGVLETMKVDYHYNHHFWMHLDCLYAAYIYTVPVEAETCEGAAQRSEKVSKVHPKETWTKEAHTEWSDNLWNGGRLLEEGWVWIQSLSLLTWSWSQYR